MVQINLLPWRAAYRRKRQQQFYWAVLITVMLALLLLYLQFLMKHQQIMQQQQQNQRLLQEIQAFDQSIEEMSVVEHRRNTLAERIQVIQTLQASRSTMVAVLDTLPRIVPDGLYFTKLIGKNGQLYLEGMTESNADVAELIHRLNDTLQLAQSRLNSIQRHNNALMFIVEVNAGAVDDNEG